MGWLVQDYQLYRQAALYLKHTVYVSINTAYVTRLSLPPLSGTVVTSLWQSASAHTISLNRLLTWHNQESHSIVDHQILFLVRRCSLVPRLSSKMGGRESLVTYIGTGTNQIAERNHVYT